MAIVEFQIEKRREINDTLTFNKSGFSFSASFIKNNKLENMRSVKIFRDEDNSYWIGFRFLEEVFTGNSLALINKQGDTGKRTSARVIKAGQLYSASAVLRNIRDSVTKASRTFEIKWDVTQRVFFVDLRPTFEHSCLFDEKNRISPDARGIYRYLNSSGEIVYIGKGVIRDRASSPERQQWQIQKIEYSLCQSDEESLRWEAFYIEDFEKLNGKIPLFNNIKGQSK